ncbi:MAG: hypothetical protein RLY74_488 [Actinomycetota bacterium]|jgi:myo-inositol-1(or 4)-monophosphatase
MTAIVELRDIALKIAQEAGDLLLNRPDIFDLSEKSGALDFATQMDKASENLITELIREIRPNDSILGEEGANKTGKSEFTWVIDPIDGTVNYLYGVPGWCVSIAVKQGDIVVAGVVHAPTVGKTWSAVLDHGAECNGSIIKCNEPIPLSKALIGTGFSYDLQSRVVQGEIFNQLITRIRDFRRLGACAVDICMVASGILDAYYEVGVYEWDFAAAGLIARESGAKFLAVPAIPSGSQHFVLVAGPSLYGELGQEMISDGRWIKAI